MREGVRPIKIFSEQRGFPLENNKAKDTSKQKKREDKGEKGEERERERATRREGGGCTRRKWLLTSIVEIHVLALLARYASMDYEHNTQAGPTRPTYAGVHAALFPLSVPGRFSLFLFEKRSEGRRVHGVSGSSGYV